MERVWFQPPFGSCHYRCDVSRQSKGGDNPVHHVGLSSGIVANGQWRRKVFAANGPRFGHGLCYDTVGFH